MSTIEYCLCSPRSYCVTEKEYFTTFVSKKQIPYFQAYCYVLTSLHMQTLMNVTFVGRGGGPGQVADVRALSQVSRSFYWSITQGFLCLVNLGQYIDPQLCQCYSKTLITQRTHVSLGEPKHFLHFLSGYVTRQRRNKSLMGKTASALQSRKKQAGYMQAESMKSKTKHDKTSKGDN